MADVVEPLEARMSALTAPIAGASPAGDDLSFDPEFEKVKAEMDKIGSVSGTPNWDQVVTLGTKLLGARTKDMRLAVWVAVARMHKTQWTGLAEGLVVLRALVDKYWDAMYPQRRPRARANLFGWLTEQVSTYFEPRDVAASDSDPLRASEILFRELDGTLSEKLGDMHTGLGQVRGLLASRIAALPRAEEPPAPGADAPDVTVSGGGTTAPANGAPPAASPAPAVSAAPPVPALAGPATTGVSSAAGVEAAIKACQTTILSAAKLVRQQDPTSTWAYHLARVGAWLHINELPGLDSGNATFVPPPPPRLAADIEGHAAASRWDALLNEAEPIVGDFPWWLDLHGWVAKALDGLGGAYKPAAQVVAHHTGGLVDRFPALLTLTFRGGRPFASPETAGWITDLRKKGGGGGAADALLEAEKKERDEKLEAARQAIAAGQVGEGIGLMLALARRAPDARGAFRMQLDAARLALEAQKPGIARPILEGLMPQIESRRLEEWDPELCTTVYVALLLALRATKPPIVDAEHREGVIIEKICRLDPALAVRMGI